MYASNNGLTAKTVIILFPFFYLKNKNLRSNLSVCYIVIGTLRSTVIVLSIGNNGIVFSYHLNITLA